MILKVGDTFKEKWINKYHVVSILTKEPETQVVLKYYGKRKQWWHYVIKSQYVIKSWLECGLYTDYEVKK